jgi:hypothetical protein
MLQVAVFQGKCMPTYYSPVASTFHTVVILWLPQNIETINRSGRNGSDLSEAISFQPRFSEQKFQKEETKTEKEKNSYPQVVEAYKVVRR